MQAQNASYGTIAEELSAMRGNEGSVDDMLNLKGLPSAKVQDLRNLAGMGGDNRCVGAACGGGWVGGDGAVAVMVLVVGVRWLVVGAWVAGGWWLVSGGG